MGGLYVLVVPRRCPPLTLWATGWVNPMQPLFPCARHPPASPVRPGTSSLSGSPNLRYGNGGWGEHMGSARARWRRHR
eukprot:4084235-Pleurochrysis_carterae.AAC.1